MSTVGRRNDRPLTERQLAALKLFANGGSRPDVARALSMTSTGLGRMLEAIRNNLALDNTAGPEHMVERARAQGYDV